MAIALLTVAFLQAASRAASETSLVEVQGWFVHATKAQLEAACTAAHADPKAMTSAQCDAVRASLKNAGAIFFDRLRIIGQSGQSADSAAVTEFRYASKYEPSKKVPDKVVPVEFVMRLLGVTLKATPTLDASGAISLEATPEFTRFLGFVDYSNLKADEKNPILEDLLKAPLNPGTVWQPWFIDYTETRTFKLQDGQSAVMSGEAAIERPRPLTGYAELRSRSPASEVVVFLTVRKVLRD